ncbi:MAG TPA: ATP-dependent DNA helicase PcrA, partial [Deltaproteobacteria bacterium]|nr:ATP-dependent DNA helicase PcrA [Deltaproteobacteria bacterium]
GDDDQSIYRWRGADVRNILDFEKDFPKARVIKLEQNYRSTKTILRAAGEVVKAIAARKEKTLWTENESGAPVVYYTGRSDKEEASFVVDRIQALQRSEACRLSDFAIFYRTNAQSRIFEDELRRRNIPYVIFGGVRFYDRTEIKDILSYLWVLANPADGLHLRRIINVPARGIGKVTLEKLEQFAAVRGVSLFDALPFAAEAGVSGSTAKKISDFHQLMFNLKAKLAAEKLSRFVQTLIESSGYLQELRAEDTLEAEGRIENLEELVSVVADYEAANAEPSLAGFLDQVSLVSDIDKLDDRSQVLPLMTLHLAKGLEFEAVFFVGMEEGLLPHSRSFDTLEEMDEERRLSYVGMTRAKKRLFLTNAERRRVFGNEQFNLPSRFLEDIPGDLIERIEPPPLRHEWTEQASFGLAKAARPAADPANPYKIGAKVRHPSFGVGTIQGCEGTVADRKVTVVFQNGDRKKLLAKLSNLTILG